MILSWQRAGTDNRAENDMERIAVSANYEVVLYGKTVTGHVEFVARVADGSQGYDLTTRAQRAVARRLRVRVADVKILGVMSS
ncbi:hypothetical protein WK13_27900 [Burkholderia ubonensis]|nr:hypothetical protein WK13_27900 [Burkholderia ubonensis]